MADFPLDFTFSPARVLRLIRNRIVFTWRSALLFTAVLTASYVAAELFLGNFSAELSPSTLWGAFGGIAGMAVAAGAFSDIHRVSRASWWFLLPASVFEKFTAALVIVLGLILLGLPLWGLGADLLARGIGYLAGRRGMEPFSFLDLGIWYAVLSSLTAAPAFLLGSVTFKKHPFIKTILVVAAGFGVLVTALSGLGWILFGDGSFSVTSGAYRWGPYTMDTNWTGLWGNGWAWNLLFWVFYPGLLLVTAFLKLGEKEVKGGVS